MSEDTKELVPVVDAQVVALGRDDKGRFAVGNPGGMRKGSANKLTRAMKLAAVEAIQAGGDASNPLLVMRDVMLTSADEKLRLDAADKLAKFIFGVNVKNAFEVEVSDGADEERVARTRKIFAALFMEETR